MATTTDIPIASANEVLHVTIDDDNSTVELQLGTRKTWIMSVDEIAALYGATIGAITIGQANSAPPMPELPFASS